MAQYKTSDITNVYWALNDGFKGGRDPMGIQNSSVATYGLILPGMTNMTGHIRYYSFYCWLLNEYGKLIKKNQTKIHMLNFLRRAELLMAFVMKDQDCRSVVGANFISYQNYTYTADGDYDIQSGADRVKNPSVKKYWVYPSGAFGQYYLGVLLSYDLVGRRENEYYLCEKGKELADAFVASVNEDVRQLFIDCIQKGAVDEDTLSILKPIGVNKIKKNSPEWQLLNHLLTKEDTDSSLRRETIFLLLRDVRNHKLKADDFVEYRYLHRKDSNLEASFAWYFYYLCEVLHYSIETIFCVILRKIDEMKNPAFNDLLNDIQKDVLKHLKKETQRYHTVEEWCVGCNRKLDGSFADLWSAVTDDDYISGFVKALPILLRLFNEYQENKQEIIQFEKKHNLDKQRGILTDGLTSYVGRHLKLGLDSFITTLVRQIMNEHTIVALNKMGNSNSDLRKFLLEEGRVVLVDVRYPVRTSPRLSSLYNYLEDMGYLNKNGNLTEIANTFLNGYGEE